MLMTHLAASRYRYYRWLLAGAVGVAILLVSLYTRYYQEVKSIEQSQQTLATRTVGKINQLLTPAQIQAERSMDMLDPTLRKRFIDPALSRRAKSGATRHVAGEKRCYLLLQPVWRPSLSAGRGDAHLRRQQRQARAAPSLAVSKGLPTLVMWTPSPAIKPAACCTYSISSCCPTFYSNRKSLTFSEWALNVDDSSLEYGRREILSRDTLTNDLRYTAGSALYPFSISLFGHRSACWRCPHCRAISRWRC